MTYTKFEIPGRGVRYRKDNKLISVRDVPADELMRLNKDQSEVPPETPVQRPDPESRDKNCIFCGEHTTWAKFIDLQTIPICQQHYYSESTGKIVQKMRETQSV